LKIRNLKRAVFAYNGAGRATSITEGDGAYRLALEYGVDNQRVKTFIYQNESLIKEKHFASNYEKVITGQTVREIAYIAAPSGLTAILIRSGGVDSLFYVYTDHLGSILQLNDETGKIVEQRVYDPWGRERDPNNWNNYLTDVGYRRTNRGYIGQEHLPQFGLINLNARLYDPAVGRFLSPDPFVQSPRFSQSFNRYSYCINNPLRYKDQSGELFGTDDFWIGFFRGLFKGENPVKSVVKQEVNCFRINAGLFAVNGKQAHNPWQIVGQLFSRFTWQGSQERVGWLVAQIQNTFGLVDNVSYFDGATVLNTNYLKNRETDSNGYVTHTGSAFTIGSFISGPSKMQADPNDPIFQHEYGRYLQSQADGPAYIPYTALPDLFTDGNDKQTAWDGNARALEYFDKYYGGIYSSANSDGKVTWDFTSNFIPGYDLELQITDPVNQAALKNNKRSPGVLDVLSGSMLPSLPFWVDVLYNYYYDQRSKR